MSIIPSLQSRGCISVLINILCIFGVLYIVELINRHSYRLLPEITIDNGNFFDHKLGVKEVYSLKEYILLKIKIYIGLKRIGFIRNEDISQYDMIALNELKQYINNELKQYIKNLKVNNPSISKVKSHIQCTLKYGKLDFYIISRSGSPTNSIKIKYESFSQDKPVLEIVNLKSVSYTYKVKSRYFRFIDPTIKTICEIKDIINTLALNINENVYLQAA